MSALFSSTSRTSRVATTLAAALVAATLGACASTGDPGPGNPAYQAGALGNGGFTFSCADTKGACLAQTNADAKAFPAGVVKGSTFRVRYVPKPGQESKVNVTIEDDGASASASTNATGGGTITCVGDKFLRPASPAGFLAVNAGLGTIVARDTTGALIEFTTIAIREPSRLAVFDASFEGNASAPSVRGIVLRKDEQKGFRVVAQDATAQILGGSFLTEWTATDPKIATVDSRDRGVVNLVGLAPGKTTITVKGLSLSAEIAVEVQP